MLNKKVVDYFFKQAAIGEWDNINFLKIEKKFKLERNSIKKQLEDKIFFLHHYDRFIDKKVMKSVSNEDFNISSPEEIIQEYIMNKLDFMNQHKLAISNIFNFYLSNPKFYLISLKSSKASIELYLNKFYFTRSNIKKKVLEKALLVILLLAIKKWLYEDKNNSMSYAIIDKGIKRIKNNTQLFEAVNKTKI